jgi:hypothetical protein
MFENYVTLVDWKESFWSDMPTYSFSPVIGVILIISLSIFIIILRLKYTQFFKIKSRYNSFIIYYLIITLIGYYYISVSHFDLSPANRHIVIIIILLIPLAISGFNKLLNLSNIISSRRKILSILFCILLFLPIGSQFISGMDYFSQNGNPPVIPPETFERNNLFYSYLRDNFDDDLVYASNVPADLYLRTGFSSVGIPNTLGCMDMDSYLNHFQPDYFVLYNQPWFPVDKNVFLPTTNIHFSEIIVPSSIILDSNLKHNDDDVYEVKIFDNDSMKIVSNGNVKNYVLGDLIDIRIFYPYGGYSDTTFLADDTGDFVLTITIDDSWISGEYIVQSKYDDIISEQVKFFVSNYVLGYEGYFIYEINYPEKIYEQKLSLLRSYNFLQDDVLDENEISKSWESLKQVAKNNFNNNNYDESLLLYSQMHLIEPYDYEVITKMLDILSVLNNDEKFDEKKISNFNDKSQKEMLHEVTTLVLLNQECFEEKWEDEPKKYFNFIKQTALILENNEDFNLASILWGRASSMDEFDTDVIMAMDRWTTLRPGN